MAIIAQYRKSKLQSMREFAAELHVSQTQVMNWENGTQEPDRTRVAQWIVDERAWVKSMGLHIFGVQFAPLIQNVLVPTP
jgi:transcriptional regulator with XRE-family HTH domain